MRWWNAKTCLWVVGLSALACVSAAAQTAGAGRSDPPGVLLDVPFVPQTKNACGPASISMVMAYWDKNAGRPPSPRASERAIERTLDPRARGVSNSALAGYLEASGYRVFAFSGRWNDLRENLSRGRPLIVALGPEDARGPLHYVVVAGLDWERNYVFVNDPAQRKLFRMDRASFERRWKATGNWTLLAAPKSPE